jgi:outer membrane protein
MIPKKILGIAALSLTALGTQSVAGATSTVNLVSVPSCAPSGCAAPASVTPLSLADAVQMALRTHPDTQAAAARLAGIRALEGQALAGAAPQLVGSIGTSTSKAGSAPATDSALAQLRLSYVLFDFGKRTSDIDAARSSSMAAELDTEATAQAVILATAEKYFTHIEARETAMAARASVESAKLSLAAAQAHFDVGMATRLDLLQAQSMLSSAELTELRARAGVAVTRAALAQQLGLRANAVVELAKVAEPTVVDLPSLETLMAQAKTQRPEATAARRRLDAAEAQRRSAQALGKPTLNMSATGGRTSYYGNGVGNQSGIGVTLDIPLFDGGLSKNQRSYARAQELLAQSNLDAQLRSVELAVVQAHSQLATSQQAYRSAQAFLFAATEALQQARGRYVAGVGPMTDWLDAQAKLASARQQSVAALLDWHNAKLALARSVGSLNTSSL